MNDKKKLLLSTIAASSLFTHGLYGMAQQEDLKYNPSRLDYLCKKQLVKIGFIQEIYKNIKDSKVLDFVANQQNNSNSNMKEATKYFISTILPDFRKIESDKDPISIINKHLESLEDVQDIQEAAKPLVQILSLKYLESKFSHANYHHSENDSNCCHSTPTLHCRAMGEGYSLILALLIANKDDFESKCPYFKVFTDQLGNDKSEKALIYFLEKVLPDHTKFVNDSNNLAETCKNILENLECYATPGVDEEGEPNEELKTKEFQKELTQFITIFFETIIAHEISFIPLEELDIPNKNAILKTSEGTLITNTPINLAAMFGLNTILCELAKKIDFDLTKNVENRAALLLLINSGKAKIETINKIENEEALLFSYKNNKQQTPLHIAILNENYSSEFCTKLIMRAVKYFCKSILEYKDIHGKTPLHLAVEEKKAAIVAVLLKLGSTKLLYIKEHSHGHTPLDLAHQSNDQFVLDIINQTRKQEVSDCLKLLEDKK